MYRWLGSIWCCWLLYLSPLSGQIKMDFLIGDATCTNNGSVMVLASGGTAPYNYEIVGNTCGFSNRSIQPSPLFLNLAPCTYTFWVMDATGQITTLNATVGGNYTGPTASVAVDGCGFTVLAKNGSPPLKYYLSTDGGKSYGMPSAQNTYTGLSNGTYFVKIEDTCRSSFITSATIALDTLEYSFNRVYRTRLTDSIAPTMISGGQGPFQFFIVNGMDTLRSVNNVFAMKDVLKSCSTQVVIQSACGRYVNAFTYTDAEIVCLDFSHGTAEIRVNIGVPPYSTQFYSPSGTSLTFSSLQLTGLPINSSYYSFSLKDRCGHNTNGAYETLYQNKNDFSFKTSSSCAEFDSLRIDIHQNNFFNKKKYNVECTSCLPTQRVTGIDQTVTLKNLNPGKTTIVFTDSCGASWTCNSEYYIPVVERCDSIRVQLINALSCDNRSLGLSYSGDTIPVDMFYLRTEQGAILDSNTLGIFSGLINGTFKIQARANGCGIVESIYTRTLVAAAPDFRIGLSKRNNNCRTEYFLNVDYIYYPYLLTDTSGKPFNATLNTTTDFGVNFDGLPPGKYILKSLLTCWQKEIELPELFPKLKQENITVCPAGGSITISGGKSFNQWQDYFKSLDLKLNYINQPADWYSLGSRESRFNYDTATHTYFNIEPGKSYTIYLHSFASTNYVTQLNACPVDSMIFTVPDYAPPSLVADLVTACDGSQSALDELRINNGTGPYTIREFECINPLNAGSIITATESVITVTGSAQGTGAQCFKVTDACLNSSQAGSGINEQQPQLLRQKNCDSTSTFYYNKISGATYSWTNSANQPLGDSSRITIADPKPGDEIKMQMTYKGCSVQKSLRIDSLTLKKFQVQIEANKRPDLCAGDSIRLNALISGGIEPVAYNWSNGVQNPETWVRNSGIQTLRVKNAIGCLDSARIEVRIGSPLELTHSQKNIDCYGDFSGSVTVKPGGGITPYQITWSDGTTQDSLSKLSAGDYSVTLIDFAGCKLVRDFKLIQNNPLMISSTTQAATCGVSRDGSIMVIATGGVPGFTYKWNSGQSTVQIRGLNPGDYQVTVTDRFACEATANIEVLSRPLLSRLQTDTICAGTHLRVGNSIYTVSGSFRDTLKTSLGCDSIVLTNLTILPPLQYTMAAVSPSCSGQSNGHISVSDILSKPPFIFSLNGKVQGSFKADLLSAGNYTIKLTDGFGCSTEKGAALSNPRRMELEAGSDSLMQIGDSILLKAVTNLVPGEIRYIQWKSDLGPICDNCTSNVIKPKKTQTIIVTLENNSGCKISDQFTLSIDNNFKVFAPNILYLHPNDNTPNSRFTLFSDQQVTEIEYLRIFDRFGDMVFEARNIQQGDLQAGWDGYFKNKPAEPGVYIFLAKIRFADDSFRMKSGDLTLIR